MPKRRSPPGAGARSNTVTVCPARLSPAAAASPAGPLPTTATVFPLREAGARGRTQPSVNARSAISFSICSMATAAWSMARTQAASHGAGQRRPVNSGKSLVEERTAQASSQRPRHTRSLKSGMRFPSGHPW